MIIIGAGAAGMMCALTAGSRNRRVLLVDHAKVIGRKILISGGGRCNFTNIHARPDNFQSANPHFCKSALSRFTPKDFIKLLEGHRIPYHEKKLGQLFCDRVAGDIVEMLVSECKKSRVTFMTGSRVEGVSRDAEQFNIKTESQTFRSSSLVIATGGLSVPETGATGFGYEIAGQFGLKVEPTFPALVGFELKARDKEQLNELTGLSFESVVSCRKHAFRENTLFTHTGLSGPAVLQASLYWNPGDPLLIDVCPQTDLRTYLEQYRLQKSSREVKNILSQILPRHFAEKLCELFLPSKPLNSLAEKTIDDFCRKLGAWSIVPERNFGYRKAEVTRGGVSTDELSSKTLESKKVPGLYFVGEVVDVTGQLGGYNFQWAWASGRAAGLAI